MTVAIKLNETAFNLLNIETEIYFISLNLSFFQEFRTYFVPQSHHLMKGYYLKKKQGQSVYKTALEIKRDANGLNNVS